MPLAILRSPEWGGKCITPTIWVPEQGCKQLVHSPFCPGVPKKPSWGPQTTVLGSPKLGVLSFFACDVKNLLRRKFEHFFVLNKIT